MRLALARRMPSTASLDRLAAGKRFGRYKSEPHQEVRRPIAKAKTLIEELRQRREMLRSMDPETAKEVIEFHKGLNFFQALALAKQEGRLIVPNDVHEGILTKTEDEQYLKQNYPVWTGTLVIYEAPDKPFGEKVVFSFFRWTANKINHSVSFEVPKQFRGKANCALVIEHPDFDLVDLGNNRYEIKAAEGIHIMKQFPKRSDWYLLHAETMIPQGKQVDNSEKARYFYRDDNSYLGFLVRLVHEYHIRRPDVSAYCDLFDNFGVALF